jgi:hypothetical protein
MIMASGEYTVLRANRCRDWQLMGCRERLSQVGPRTRKGAGETLDHEFDQIDNPNWVQEIRHNYDEEDDSSYDDDTVHDLDCPGPSDCICGAESGDE